MDYYKGYPPGGSGQADRKLMVPPPGHYHRGSGHQYSQFRPQHTGHKSQERDSQGGNEKHRGGNGGHFRPGSNRGNFHGGRGNHDKFRGNGGRGGRGRGRGGPANRGPSKPKQQQPLPEVKHNFYCCSCERGFRTQEQFDKHNGEHVVCGLEGCTFEAHSLVVTKHVRIQHDGNLYERMKNLNTPEGIERWREERKKNFPSADKVQAKCEERKKKEERREICGLQPQVKRREVTGAHPNVAPTVFRYKIQPNDKRQRSYMEYQRRLRKIENDQSDAWMRRSFAPDKKMRHIRVPFFSMNKSKVVHLESFYLNVTIGKEGRLKKKTKVAWKGFKAKQLNRLEDSESETEQAGIGISDSEEDESKEQDQMEEKQVEAPSIRSVMLVNYYSSSESDSEENECKQIEQKTDETKSQGVLQSPVVDTTSKEALEKFEPESPGESEFVIEEFTKDNTFKDKPVFKKPRNIRKKKWFKNKLLETLLQDQIRKERNIVMQVCRYVHRNKFFDQAKQE